MRFAQARQLGPTLGAVAAGGLGAYALGNHLRGDDRQIGVVDGQPVTMNDLRQQYSTGNHIVDGGPEVGLFWASNIQSPSTLQPLPLSHGTEALGISSPSKASIDPASAAAIALLAGMTVGTGESDVYRDPFTVGPMDDFPGTSSTPRPRRKR